MTSKFFCACSSSEGSCESSSSESQVPQTAVGVKTRAQQWVSTSSSDEDVAQKRVVRTWQAKQFEQLATKCRDLQSHMKAADFAELICDYEALLKVQEKAKPSIEADVGNHNMFIKAIGSLEEYVVEKHEEYVRNKADGKKSLSASKQRSFNILRQKVRNGNLDFKAELTKFRENPEGFESEVAKSSPPRGSGSSRGSSSGSSGSPGDYASSDSDSEPNGSSNSDSLVWGSDSSDESGGDCDEDAVREERMLKWLITKERRKDVNNVRQKPHNEEQTRAMVRLVMYSWRDFVKGKNREIANHVKDPHVCTEDALIKKVTEMSLARGKKGFDREAYIVQMLGLMQHAEKLGPRIQLYVYAMVVPTFFDDTGSCFAAMTSELWNSTLDYVNEMCPLLRASYKQLLDRGASPEEILSLDDSETDPTNFMLLQTRFISFVEKLDDELYKAFQLKREGHGAEYIDMLASSWKVLVLCKRLLKFFEDTEQTVPLGNMALRVMTQLHFKPDALNAAVHESIRASVAEDEKAIWEWPLSSRALMSKLCRHAWGTDETAKQQKALLMQAYHLALHGHFHPARDLLHLSHHLCDRLVASAEVCVQIMYNRTVAQMGLCAFRLGRIEDAHTCLLDFYEHGSKAKELLAQGLAFNRSGDRQEEERAERSRQIPYHMHIDLEVVDCAFYISAMLLEVPHMTMQALHPTNKRIISRHLRKAIDLYDRSDFNGPPENTRDAVVHAAKSLEEGNWQQAIETLESLKIWDHLDLGSKEAGKQIKEVITDRIKTEALRTYLFAHASIYDAFHRDQLVSMFNMTSRAVHSVVSKMMIKEEIVAFWDESSSYLLVQHLGPSPLQCLALALVDRAAEALEMNERLVEHKTRCLNFPDGVEAKRDFHANARCRNGPSKGTLLGGVAASEGKGKGRGKARMSAQSRGWDNVRAALGSRVGALGAGWR